MIETIIALIPTFLPIIIIGIGMVLSWIVGKGWLTKQFADALKSDVSAAVTMTHLEYVKEIKNASADGTLTEDEKKNARQIALNNLIVIGKANGKNYAKEHLLPNIMNLIEIFVTKKKAGTEEI